MSNLLPHVESALDGRSRARVSQLGHADITIGLPTYKNARTIANVIGMLTQGLADSFPGRSARIIIADGGSTDDTLAIARSTRLPEQVSLVAMEYQGLTGKGSAIRAILECARVSESSACAVLDADLRSITPEWIERLVGPILTENADFVCPLYTRDRHEVTINDMIAYPLTRSLYGQDIRHPLGGEIGLAAHAWERFLSKDVWETDVARFGIHIWMVTQAVTSGWRVYQAQLGTKTHDYKDPTVGFEPKFLQIVGTLFRMMTFYRRVWPEVEGVRELPTWGKSEPREPSPVPTTRQTLWDGFTKGRKRYRRNLAAILTKEQMDVVMALGPGNDVSFPPEMWARIVAEFAVVYNRGEGDPDKVALALLPLYYARKASMLRDLEGKPWTAVDEAIRSQANRFVAAKPYLVERWAKYVPWQAPLSASGPQPTATPKAGRSKRKTRNDGRS